MCRDLGNRASPVNRAHMKRPLVSYAAVLCLVTWGGALRDETKNGCIRDYRTVSEPVFYGSLYN